MKPQSLPFSLIPSQPGTYVLILRLASPTEVRVGKLGTFRCPAGWYAYVGSALGPGGLAARLARHRRQHRRPQSRRPHWHIDYLLAVSELIEIWWMASAERRECAWAETLGRAPGATTPLPGFGASDCRCPSHVSHLAHRPSPFTLSAQLEDPPSLCCTPVLA